MSNEEISLANYRDVLEAKGSIVALTVVVSRLLDGVVDASERNDLLAGLQEAIRLNIEDRGERPITPAQLGSVMRGIANVFDNLRK